MPDVGRKAPNKSHVQSVFFAKEQWEKKAARKWLREHDYYTDGLDETDKLYRFRQYDPNDKKFRYRNKSIGDGITLVNAYPKSKSSLDEREVRALGICGEINTIAPFKIEALLQSGVAPEADLGELFRLYKQAEAAGELFKLRVGIVPHLQAGGNGNFWRILDSAYPSIAASFVGQVFQRNHSLLQQDRGGTILQSRAVGSGPSSAMEMVVEVSDPWAIEGFLRKLIDRFSIQLNIHDIKAYCSICGADIFDWCSHMPGQSYDVQGVSTVCWWEVHSGTGKEVSAVTDPAVAGTGVKELSQLAASLRSPQTSKEDDMEIQELQAALAEEEQELAAAQKDLADHVARLADVTAQLATVKTELAAAQEALQSERSRANGVLARSCSDLVSQINELRADKKNTILFEKDGPVTFDASACTDIAASEDGFRRLLLADKILVAKEIRNTGPDFNVMEERAFLMAQSAEALAFALSILQKTSLPVTPPPQGNGIQYLPGDGARADNPTTPSQGEDDGVDTFDVEQLLALSTGRADVR